MSQKKSIPIWEKYALTVPEAAQYFGVGQQLLRSLIDEEKENPSSSQTFYFQVGSRSMIKRKLFERYMDDSTNL